MDILKLSQYQERSYNETPNPRGWVNYGDDNLFPQYLVDLYKSSAVHGALCNTISQMVFGNGVSASDIETRLKLQEWGFDDELRKACLDLKIQGGFALEIGFSIDRTTIASIKHCPFENLRSAEANEQDEVDFYWFSRDWSDQREEPVKVKAFDPEHKNEYPNQVLYVKPFAPGSFYYPKPDYVGAVNYIELDKEISKYHVNNIRNGLAPSFTIHFKNGVPAPEERRKIRNDIERQLSGTTNAGKFIVTYSDQPDRKPDFEPFPLSDADKQYEFLSTEATDKIMIGHRVVSPAMFGVKTAGQLGNQQELDIASGLFDDQVVKPFQRIIKDAVKRILVASGLNPSIVIDEAPSTENLSKKKDDQPASEEAYRLSKLQTKGEAADWLIEQGEVVDEDLWELLDERDVEYEKEQTHDALWTFARIIIPDADRPTGGVSELDNDIIKIRYAYDGDKNPQRDFCKKMMRAKRVYRREDIVGDNWPATLGGASARAVNPGFGPGGSDTYDLLLFKGGANCKHRWVRRTYLRKNNKRVSVAEARRIINKLPIEERAGNRIPPNDDPRVSQTPNTMPNKGYLNPR